MLTEHPIPPSLLHRRSYEQHAVAPESGVAPPSLLRKPNHAHPFAPFLAEDVAGIALAVAGGFDAMWRDERGMTCAMACAERGLTQSLFLAFESSPDPQALALAKLESGIDAFDLAAAKGAVSCMVEISRRLPTNHRSAISHGFMWHAVEASLTRPDLAQAWIVDLCVAPKSLLSGRGATEALTRAREIGWAQGINMLTTYLGLPNPTLSMPSTPSTAG